MCGMVYNGNSERAPEMILEHKIKYSVQLTVSQYKCDQCTFKGLGNLDLNEHIESNQKEERSSEFKKNPRWIKIKRRH